MEVTVVIEGRGASLAKRGAPPVSLLSHIICVEDLVSCATRFPRFWLCYRVAVLTSCSVDTHAREVFMHDILTGPQISSGTTLVMSSFSVRRTMKPYSIPSTLSLTVVDVYNCLDFDAI